MTWEQVSTEPCGFETWRLLVPSGWLYRVSDWNEPGGPSVMSMTFVPATGADSTSTDSVLAERVETLLQEVAQLNSQLLAARSSRVSWGQQ